MSWTGDPVSVRPSSWLRVGTYLCKPESSWRLRVAAELDTVPSISDGSGFATWSRLLRYPCKINVIGSEKVILINEIQDITKTCLVAVINCDMSIQTVLFCANFPLVQSTSTEKGGGVKMDSPIFSWYKNTLTWTVLCVWCRIFVPDSYSSLQLVNVKMPHQPLALVGTTKKT